MRKFITSDTPCIDILRSLNTVNSILPDKDDDDDAVCIFFPFTVINNHIPEIARGK